MSSNTLTHIVRFVLIFLLQVIALNNIDIAGMVNIYLYPLCIFMLPLSMSLSLTLIIALTYGLLIDIFSGTIGMHALALVFVAYIRIFLAKYTMTREQIENDVMHMNNLNITGFAIIFFIFLFLHHLLYFFVEIGTFYHILYTLSKIILSTLSTLLFAVLLLLIFPAKAKNKY